MHRHIDTQAHCRTLTRPHTHRYTVTQSHSHTAAVTHCHAHRHRHRHTHIPPEGRTTPHTITSFIKRSAANRTAVRHSDSRTVAEPASSETFTHSYLLSTGTGMPVPELVNQFRYWQYSVNAISGTGHFRFWQCQFRNWHSISGTGSFRLLVVTYI